MNIQEFQFPFKNTQLKGNILGKDKPNVIFLHGAGNTTATSFDSIRIKLAEDGFSSVAFDCIGHGKTGGDLQSSSLLDRTEQAMKVMENFQPQRPLVVVGRSMGGYTALRLIELYPVDILILLVPAVYAKEVYGVNFGEKFTNIIRQERSWENSDAWDTIKKFKGKLLVISAELDEVIPKEIPSRIYDAAVNASEKDFYAIPQSSHNITKYLTENKKEFSNVYRKIHKIISGR